MYTFIKADSDEFSVRAKCRVLGVHVSSFYAWLKNDLCWQANFIRTLDGAFALVSYMSKLKL